MTIETKRMYVGFMAAMLGSSLMANTGQDSSAWETQLKAEIPELAQQEKLNDLEALLLKNFDGLSPETIELIKKAITRDVLGFEGSEGQIDPRAALCQYDPPR